MAKLPEPPPAGGLARRLAPEVLVLPAGTSIWRIYFRGGGHPGQWDEFCAWGPKADARFDHHVPPPHVQDRRILYGAIGDIRTCLAEVFQTSRTIDRTFREPWLVGFETASALRLLDLTRAWPTQPGASMAIATGSRDRARRWSTRIHEDYPKVEGLVYPSSMDANRPAVALYERAELALPSRPLLHRALADPALDGMVAGAALRFGYDIVP